MSKTHTGYGKSPEVSLQAPSWEWRLDLLLGIVYVFGRSYLPFSGDIKRAVFLSLIICLALFVIPFLKYPGNPPAVGNPDTIYLRESLYLGFLAVSAVSALGLGVLFYRFRGVRHIRIIIPLVYAVIMSSAFALFPSNPDKITIPMDLVSSFRIASGLTMVGFWVVLGVVFGLLWYRFRPHEASEKPQFDFDFVQILSLYFSLVYIFHLIFPVFSYLCLSYFIIILTYLIIAK